MIALIGICLLAIIAFIQYRSLQTARVIAAELLDVRQRLTSMQYEIGQVQRQAIEGLDGQLHSIEENTRELVGWRSGL